MSGLKLSKFSFRRIIQVFFALLSLYIGWEFIQYYQFITSGGMTGSMDRPPGVDAFVPLSALVGLRSWIGTGVYDHVHPAGLTILLTAFIISFLFRKSFCSWICPFGFLEEILTKIGNRILPKRLRMPGWLDMVLRSIKYILLAFFVYSVFFGMSAEAAAQFLELPYNKIVDIKMLEFFLNISTTGIIVFSFLIIMSILFDHFWCRYLCPYGALLGILGWFSPSIISRAEDKCIGCNACDKVCPGHLKISCRNKVLSPECNGCMSCIEKCPVPGALEYKFLGRFGGPKYLLPVAMLIVFTAAITVAKATGYWESGIGVQEVYTYYTLMGQF